MAGQGNKIYFGKLVNAEVDMVWVAGVVAEDRDHAIDRLQANIDDEEMELIELSVDQDNIYTLFEDLDDEEKVIFKDNDFYLFDPDSLQ